MFLHQFTIGKTNVSNGISLNIGVVVRNTSTSHIEVSLFLFGQLQSQYWAQKRNGPVCMIWFQYTWPTLIIINLSVFSVCLSCCVSQKKSALGASTMRGPCVSLLSAAHRGRPPLTPWYTGTQQLGPLGGAGCDTSNEGFFQLSIMHTRCFSSCPGCVSEPCPVEWKRENQIVQQFRFVQANILMNILTLRSFSSLSKFMAFTDNRV